MGLTPVQAQIATCIGELTEVLGRPPILTEVADELDMSRGQAHRVVEALCARRWLNEEFIAGRRYLALRHPAPPLPPEDYELTEAGRAYPATASEADVAG